MAARTRASGDRNASLRAISETKRFAHLGSLLPDFEIASEWDARIALIVRPAAQERINKSGSRSHWTRDFTDRTMWNSVRDITSLNSGIRRLGERAFNWNQTGE